MKVLTFSRHFPAGHPKAGQPTWFVESILNVVMRPEGALRLDHIPAQARELVNDFELIANKRQKHHTIRAGSRFKPGDMVSLRVWSDKPYRSKQIEFAQVEVRKVWSINIHIVGNEILWQLPGLGSGAFNCCSEGIKIIARNDGLDVQDFIDWFVIHPKKKHHVFTGQVVCWDDKINY